MYEETQAAKAVLSTLVEIFEFMQTQDVEEFERIPHWLERPLHQVINAHGLTTIEKLMSKFEFSNCPTLVEAV